MLFRSGSLLFVRTSGHLGRAIREVNEVLSYRRRRLTPGEEVLAVIECDDVESSPLLSGHTDPVSPRGDLVVRESFGLSGVWNLCCFDITILRHPVTPEQRRGRLLDALCLGHDVASRDAPAAARLARLRVLPVFAPTEVLDDVEIAKQNIDLEPI